MDVTLRENIYFRIPYLNQLMLQIFTSLQCFATLQSMGVICVYPTLNIALTAIACSQFDKLKAAILDITQQHITPEHRQEDEQVDIITNCDLQAKLNACIRHHQNTIK